MADTSIRLWHIGQYAYGWEDAGQDRVRHDSFLFLMSDGEKQPATPPSQAPSPEPCPGGLVVMHISDPIRLARMVNKAELLE